MVRIPEELIGLIAVLTLPAGLLALFTFGLDVALVVFVVGWLALVPGLGVLREWLGDDGTPADAAGARADPQQQEDALETLRERYARGEIDEVTFERKIEDLIETENGPDRPGATGRTNPAPDRDREFASASEPDPEVDPERPES